MEFAQDPNNLNLIILVAAGVAIGLIFFRVAQNILKTVLIIGVVGLAVYFWQGGSVDELGQESIGLFFKESSYGAMLEVNCPEKKADKSRCDCVVNPVFEDLGKKYSDAQLDELDDNWEDFRREIGVSMKENKKEIRKCLQEHGGKYIDKLKDFFGSIGEKE
ncbi:MAG: hypothetical protein AAFY71_24165 [Bacteroidota bacterium]